MRFLYLLLFILFSPITLPAQEIRGRIINAYTYMGVPDVLVANKRTSESVYTDSAGYYNISALDGDILFCYRLGYNATREDIRIINGKIAPIAMIPSDLKLNEVQVQGNTYKMDSIERSIIYRKALKDASEKVHVSLSNGISFNGIFGKLASILTGREKRLKHFKNRFLSDEQEKFISSRYTPALVKRLTGLEGEKAILFINTCPMPYDFARVATELELQSWIRSQYKEYVRLGKDKQKPIISDSLLINPTR